MTVGPRHTRSRRSLRVRHAACVLTRWARCCLANRRKKRKKREAAGAQVAAWVWGRQRGRRARRIGRQRLEQIQAERRAERGRREHAAAARLQREARGWILRLKLERSRKIAARGRQIARRRQRRDAAAARVTQWGRRCVAVRRFQARVTAAISIQTWSLSCKQVRDFRTKKAATMTIQRVLRGRLDRQTVHIMRALRRLRKNASGRTVQRFMLRLRAALRSLNREAAALQIQHSLRRYCEALKKQKEVVKQQQIEPAQAA